MMQKTNIEYLTHTWNPIAMRCRPVSAGCANCWHLAFCDRHAANPNFSESVRAAYSGGTPVLKEKELTAPLRCRKPSVIGVQFMGDLFCEDVPFNYITQIFDVMCGWRWLSAKDARSDDHSLMVNPAHTFVVLTKRPERIPAWLNWVFEYWPGDSPFNVAFNGKIPKHILIGTSIDDQKSADERIPLLLQTPAAKRFVSLEPLLDEVDLNNVTARLSANSFVSGTVLGSDGRYFSPGGANGTGVDCVIVGAESGSKRRECKPEWIDSIVDQCRAAGVPVFVKQAHHKGKVIHPGDPKWPSRWPQEKVSDQ